MSIISKLTLLATAGSAKDLDYYWFDVYGTTQGSPITDIAVDSQGATVEYYKNLDSIGGFLTKREPDGSIIWQVKVLQNYGQNFSPENARIDFDENRDIMFAFTGEGNNGSIAMTLHSGTDGSLMDGPVYINPQLGSGGIDINPRYVNKLSNGNYLVTCDSQSHTFNSTLDNIVTTGRNVPQATNIGTDSSGNTVMYRTSAGGTLNGQFYFWLIGFNPTTGTKVYEKRIQHQGLNWQINKYLTDGTNTYLVGNFPASGVNSGIVVRLTAEGSTLGTVVPSISWGRYYGGVTIMDAVLLSTGGIVTAGVGSAYTQSAAVNSINIVSYSTTGTWNYLHSFGPKSGGGNPVITSRDMTIDENDNIYIPCHSAGVGNKVAMLKIPAEGAVTQTLAAADTGLSNDLGYLSSWTNQPTPISGGLTANTTVNTVATKTGVLGVFGAINVTTSTLTHTQVDVTT